MLDTSEIYELMDSQPIMSEESTTRAVSVDTRKVSGKKRKHNEAMTVLNIKKANKVTPIEIKETEPNVKEIGLFPITEVPVSYVEKDLHIVKIPITESFYVSYNIKDVTKTGGSKGRIEVYQINRKYVSKEGEPKVFSMKINGNEVQNTIRALTYLVTESAKQTATKSN